MTYNNPLNYPILSGLCGLNSQISIRNKQPNKQTNYLQTLKSVSSNSIKTNLITLAQQNNDGSSYFIDNNFNRKIFKNYNNIVSKVKSPNNSKYAMYFKTQLYYNFIHQLHQSDIYLRLMNIEEVTNEWISQNILQLVQDDYYTYIFCQTMPTKIKDFLRIIFIEQEKEKNYELINTNVWLNIMYEFLSQYNDSQNDEILLFNTLPYISCELFLYLVDEKLFPENIFNKIYKKYNETIIGYGFKFQQNEIYKIISNYSSLKSEILGETLKNPNIENIYFGYIYELFTADEILNNLNTYSNEVLDLLTCIEFDKHILDSIKYELIFNRNYFNSKNSKLLPKKMKLDYLSNYYEIVDDEIIVAYIQNGLSGYSNNKGVKKLNSFTTNSYIGKEFSTDICYWETNKYYSYGYCGTKFYSTNKYNKTENDLHIYYEILINVNDIQIINETSICCSNFTVNTAITGNKLPKLKIEIKNVDFENKNLIKEYFLNELDIQQKISKIDFETEYDSKFLSQLKQNIILINQSDKKLESFKNYSIHLFSNGKFLIDNTEHLKYYLDIFEQFSIEEQEKLNNIFQQLFKNLTNWTKEKQSNYSINNTPIETIEKWNKIVSLLNEYLDEDRQLEYFKIKTDTNNIPNSNKLSSLIKNDKQDFNLKVLTEHVKNIKLNQLNNSDLNNNNLSNMENSIQALENICQDYLLQYNFKKNHPDYFYKLFEILKENVGIKPEFKNYISVIEEYCFNDDDEIQTSSDDE